jgi:hypothetical protein
VCHPPPIVLQSLHTDSVSVYSVLLQLLSQAWHSKQLHTTQNSVQHSRTLTVQSAAYGLLAATHRTFDSH